MTKAFMRYTFVGMVFWAFVFGWIIGILVTRNDYQKDAAKHGYGYFNENKEFVWK